MTRGLKIIGGILAMIAVILVGGGAYVLNIDLNDWKQEIQHYVHKSTGRTLTLNGPIEFELGTDTYFKASDITFSNADWGSRPHMAEVGTVELGFKLFSLLGGTPDITLLRAEKIRVILETGSSGERNTDFRNVNSSGQGQKDYHGGHHDGGGDFLLPILRDMKITDVDVVMKDALKGTEQAFTLSQFTLGSTSVTDPLKLYLDAVYNAQTLVMQGEVGSLASMDDEALPTPIDITGNLAGVDVSVRGEILDMASQKGIDITISALGEELADAARSFARIDVPRLGRFKVDATVSGDSQSLAIVPLKIDIGTSEVIRLTVDGSVKNAMQQQGINLTVTMNSVQIGNLSPVMERLKGQSVPSLGPLDLSFVLSGEDAKALGLKDLTLALGDPKTFSVEARGQIKNLLEQSGMDLGVQVISPDLSVLSGTVGSPVPAIGPLNMSATLGDDGDRSLIVNPFQATIAESDIGGTIRLALNGRVPGVTADLRSTRFNTKDISASSGGRSHQGASQTSSSASSQSTSADDGRIIPDAPLPLGLLGSINADISYKAETFVAAVAEMKDLDIKLSLKEGDLTITPFTAAIGQGKVEGALSLDGRKEVAPLSVKVEGRDIGLDALLAGAGMRDKIAGPLDISVDLKGAGQNPRALASSLNGNLGINLHGSRILKKAFEDVTGPAVAEFLASDGGWIVIDCAVFNYDLSDGLATTKAGYMASGPVTVVTEGTANLASEELDMDIDSSGGIVSLPLVVGGTFASPSITPDPGRGGLGLLAGVLTGGLAPALAAVVTDLPQDHPCRDAIAESRQQMQKQESAPVKSAEEALKKGLENVIEEGLGQGLKNLFGD